MIRNSEVALFEGPQRASRSRCWIVTVIFASLHRRCGHDLNLPLEQGCARTALGVWAKVASEASIEVKVRSDTSFFVASLPSSCDPTHFRLSPSVRKWHSSATLASAHRHHLAQSGKQHWHASWTTYSTLVCHCYSSKAWIWPLYCGLKSIDRSHRVTTHQSSPKLGRYSNLPNCADRRSAQPWQTSSSPPLVASRNLQPTCFK